jgi:hypothetical protein
MTSHGPAAAVRPLESRISRPLILHLRGDWGTANLHRVCGWISQELATSVHDGVNYVRVAATCCRTGSSSAPSSVSLTSSRRYSTGCGQ